MVHFGRLVLVLSLLGLCSFSSLAAQDHTAPYRLIVADRNFPEGQVTISRVDTASGAVENLVSVNASEAEFRISPQGDRIAYSALLDWEKAWDCCPETGTSAFIFDLNSGENTLIAENTTLSGGSTRQVPDPPVWSPDGQQVMVVHLDDEDMEKHEIVIAGADGETIRTLKPERFPTNDVFWSPDGTTLAYYSDIVARSSYGLVFVVRTDGTDTGRVLLTNNDPPQDTDTNHGYSVLGWIPGTHDLMVTRGILYEPDTAELLRVNADDGTIKTLIPTDKMPSGYSLKILNDGRAWFGSNNPGDYQIYWLDYDTGALTPTPIQGGLLEKWSNRVFSPDQTKAAITRYDADSKVYGIAVYDLETGTRLADIPVTTDYIFEFAWSPDGQQIAVATAEPIPSNDTAIYILNADGSGTPQQVAQNVGTTLIGWQT